MNAPPLRKQPLSGPKKDQIVASDPRLCVWVNASAGSGKTTVLTARVMRLLLAGTAPEKLLCLTYTRAGAAEMSNRITAVLSRWAACDEDLLRDDLDNLQNAAPAPEQLIEARRLFARVLSCPGGLRIRTIHSFCQEILSRFPIEAGLPPHFELIDEQELETLKNEVLDELLAQANDAPESDLARALAILVSSQSEHSFSDILKEATKTWRRLANAPDQKQEAKVLANKTRLFLNLSPEDTPESFRRDAMERVPEQELRKINLLLQKGTTHKDVREKLAGFLSLPKDAWSMQFDTYKSIFLTQKNEPRKNFAGKDIMTAYPEIGHLADREGIRLMSVLERIDAAEIAQTTQSVLAFGLAFSALLAERKAQRAWVDYDDLIMHTERLLLRTGSAEWVLYKLDKGLDHILVDEAQDTSRAQWNIVRSLSEEFFSGEGARANTQRTLFVVGDEKQSIFSFQNADPDAFLSLCDYFSRRLRAADKSLEMVPMRTSFRSARAVLDAVDAVFAFPEIRQGVSQEPVRHVSFPNPDGSEKIGRVEVWPMIAETEKHKTEDGIWLLPTTREDDHDPQVLLASQIATKIERWLIDKEALPGENRPIAPGDIMILLRNRGRFADIMVRALKSKKIPVTGVDRMHLTSQISVMDLLALVRFVLLPEDDLNLATVLRGPLIGLEENDLMSLAIGRQGSLWESLKASDSHHDEMAYLAQKMGEADFSTPFDFLSRVLGDACPGNRESGKKALWTRLGNEAMDPIEELLNKAQSFCQNKAPSLQNFIQWMTQSDVEIKREMDRAEGQVRIMTVHASKGLEAPIVFLPDTTSVPRSNDIQPFQWSDDGAPVFLKRMPVYNAARQLHEKARNKQMQEYRRLLYVAMTRASRQLYVCGWQTATKDEAPKDSWYSIISSALRPKHQEHLASGHQDVVPEIVFADPSGAQKAVDQAKSKPVCAPPLPAWALQKAPHTPRAHTGGPAFDQDTGASSPNKAYSRGRIIHRLLQSLPDVLLADRPEAARRFLSHPRHGLATQERVEIENEVISLIEDERFQSLFGLESLAEAPLTGRIGDTSVFRQIDRLCFKDDEVWIVDYKTNRPPPKREADIPAAYRRQVEEYRTLLCGIYPEKNIRCFLLWTFAPVLMEIGAPSNA